MIEVNPFYDHPLDASEIDLVVDRKREEEILEQALAAASRGFRQNFALLGDEGSGKSSLLNLVEGKGRHIANLLIIRQEITSSTTELTFFKSIVGAVIRELEKLLGRSLFGDVKDIEKRVGGIVREESSIAEVSISIGALLTFLGFGGKFSAGERVVKGRYEDVSEILPSLETVVNLVLSKKFKVIVVMVDEAGYAVSETTKALLQRIRLLFQRPQFMLIVSGNLMLIEDLTGIEPTFPNLIPVTARISLAALGQSDVRQLIESRLARVRKGKGVEPFTVDAADEVWRQSKGGLRDAILICHEALELANLRTASSVEVEDVLGGTKTVLAAKGRDIFSKLKEHEREIAYKLHEVGEDSLRSFAQRLGKKPSTVSVQMKRLTNLGYVEIVATKERRTFYRLSRPLDEYLKTL
jgi:DNA-binding transcriptional ArsR family regulator/energy-coupling factor transporter ATP-binding protein EcfA2